MQQNVPTGQAGPPAGARPPGPPPPVFKWGVVEINQLTVRFVVVGGVVALLVLLVGLAVDERGLLADGWPEVLAITLAIIWAHAGINDFRSKLYLRIPQMIKAQAENHPFPWFRRYLRAVVAPQAKAYGVIIPVSMFFIAASYLTGIIPVAAAAGALFLTFNMALFLALQRDRDVFLLLTVTQIVVIATAPDGIRGLIDLAD
ncbi:MAG TPA: hypothetical protein VNL15_04380 [Dehalococcoidia bacterium]|nr:hypothetical protein [Dehalococcoidia bacterium]